jgi:hypothetical protein
VKSSLSRTLNKTWEIPGASISKLVPTKGHFERTLARMERCNSCVVAWHLVSHSSIIKVHASIKRIDMSLVADSVGCPCEACEETKRLIIEERSLPCGCKCQNCQQPIPTLKAEGPPLNIGTELSNPPQINGQPVANAKNKREPAQSVCFETKRIRPHGPMAIISLLHTPSDLHSHHLFIYGE